MNKSWNEYLDNYCNTDTFKNLLLKVEKLYDEEEVFPQKEDVFRVFNLIEPENIKVVIIGQDPYHGVNEAMGLAFSVNKNVKVPPSLKNIFKELNSDLGIKISSHGDLTKWAKEGVFLINSVLTVKKDTPQSHSKIGWQSFTDFVIQKISEKGKNIVFILLGNYAKDKSKLIDDNKHLVLITTHPSPFSARNGFFGSKIFSKTNEYLEKNKKTKIDWSL